MTTSHTHQPEIAPPPVTSFLEVSSTLAHEGAASTQSSFTRVDHMHPPTSSISSHNAETEQTTPPSPAVPLTPQIQLSFLLQSGKRRTMSFDPETTVGRVKELVWNGWPPDWQDEQPPTPSYLRILYLGKMLQDEDSLTKLRFPMLAQTPTIVHLSIRPSASPLDSGAFKKKKWQGNRNATGVDVGEDGERGCCCGCVIC